MAREMAAEMLLEVTAKVDAKATREEMIFAVDYLALFGYIGMRVLENVTVNDLKEAVSSFQKWFNLERNGTIDKQTLRAMQTPRCGCPDIMDEDNIHHRGFQAMVDRQEQSLNQWRKTGLTYFINSYVPELDRVEQDAIIKGAFGAWDEICGLTIQQTNNPNAADLIIDTGEGRRSNFDGPGGTLAWAYLPQGDDQPLLMRFDIGERWTSSPTQRGVMMFNVACHEFGHLLGLTHSKVEGALMAPYYNPNVSRPQWNDDIPRIQARYPNPSGPVTPPTPPAPGEETFVLRCRNLQVEGYNLLRK